MLSFVYVLDFSLFVLVFPIIRSQRASARLITAVVTVAAVIWGERRGFLEPEGLANCDVDTGGVVQRGQVDKPDPISERRLDVPGCRQRQARLPDAPRARQRHEPHGLAEEIRTNGLQLASAADQRRRIDGTVAGSAPRVGDAASGQARPTRWRGLGLVISLVLPSTRAPLNLPSCRISAPGATRRLARCVSSVTVEPPPHP